MESSPHMNDPINTDVAIVGAGPCGLFQVFELGMLRTRSVLIDALPEIGGQCTALYPEKPIYDIPGHPAIDGASLIANLERQIEPFAAPRLLGQRVERLSGEAGGFELVTSAGATVRAKAIVIAGGSGAFGPNRPPLDGIEGYEAGAAGDAAKDGRGVFYAVRSRAAFQGRMVVIAGGGDSAVDWAISLAELAAKVFVVHRRPQFRAAPESVARMESLAASGRIEMVVPYQLGGLEGDGRVLSGVVVRTLAGETRTLPADALLAFFGLSMELGPIADWGLALERKMLRVDPATQATSVPGIYAVGDIATYPGKLKLILQGFSEAAVAAHAIHGIVHPGVALHFEYSTTKGVPA